MPMTPKDLERYRLHAKALGLSGPQIDEAFIALQGMMGHFVDMAFGDAPIQRAAQDDLQHSAQRHIEGLAGTQVERVILLAQSSHTRNKITPGDAGCAGKESMEP